MSDLTTLTAAVDRDDRLASADDGFAAINDRAGGRLGLPIAVPQFATIVRLARRLRIPIARTVTIADGEQDLDCWIKGAPSDAGVTLTMSVLRERPAWRAPAPSAALADTPPPPGADWTWETDAELRVLRVAADGAVRHGFDPASALTSPLSRLFVLEPGPDGGLPILEAVAARRDFDRQVATVRTSGQRVTLSASARLDAAGGFAGFVGGTFPADTPAVSPPAPPRGLTGAFNARLDHILRGPLGRIVANADSINLGGEGPLDPHYVEYAADIASAGRHLLGLVDDLVDLEAIERDDFVVGPEQIDLADVARRAASLLATHAADAGVSIDRGDLHRALPARGEFRRTLQILVNLIGNAIRYSPRGAAVWLRLQREGDRVVAIVADQGKGIAPENHARIFEKFERLDCGETGGSGLGLYIARRLARAMGGNLTVDSAPGEGARFVLTLPAA